MINNQKIVIREIENNAELRAVEELQKEVWGIPDRDVVPLMQLIAVKTVGGILLGAFDLESLAGFVYGFVGFENRDVVYHSDMLAVRPAYRNSKLGYRLKLAQREYALARGVKRMTWTFDPLQSLNAHFNFNKLGVHADRYLVNFYGEDSASLLHNNGTDRLWVNWFLDSPHVAQRITLLLTNAYHHKDISEAIRLVKLGENNAPITSDQQTNLSEILSASPQYVSIDIPEDINAVQFENPGLAAEWRNATRQAFIEATTAGYYVAEFVRMSSIGRSGGTYMLQRRQPKEASR